MNAMDYITALSILGISDTATTSFSKVRKAYLKRALELHPDRQRTEEDKRKANEAFVRLREAYDMVLRERYPESMEDARAFLQGEEPHVRTGRPNGMFGIDLSVHFDPRVQMNDEQKAEAESLLREWLEETSSTDEDASGSRGFCYSSSSSSSSEEEEL